VAAFLAIHEPIWQAYAANPTTPRLTPATVLNSIPTINATLATFRAQNGAPQIGDSDYSASMSAHYSFRPESRLHGLGIGPTSSYRGPSAGYQVNQDGSVNLKNKNYASGPRYVNLNIDYARPLLHGRYMWSVYLQLTNAFNENGLIPASGLGLHD